MFTATAVTVAPASRAWRCPRRRRNESPPRFGFDYEPLPRIAMGAPPRSVVRTLKEVPVTRWLRIVVPGFLALCLAFGVGLFVSGCGPSGTGGDKMNEKDKMGDKAKMNDKMGDKDDKMKDHKMSDKDDKMSDKDDKMKDKGDKKDK
jgi:hypothetical protein